MPDPAQRISPLAGALVPGEDGIATPEGPSVLISERHGLSIGQVAARRGQAGPATSAIQQSLGIGPLPEANAVVSAGRASALWIAPDQWLLVAEAMAEGELERRLREAVQDFAAVTDQSHARCVIRIAGPQTRALLAKGCALDLDPRAFPPGRCAQTMVGPVAALLHLVDEAPTFDLHVSRGYALAFWQWLIDSAGEFGYRVR